MSLPTASDTLEDQGTLVSKVIRTLIGILRDYIYIYIYMCSFTFINPIY